VRRGVTVQQLVAGEWFFRLGKRMHRRLVTWVAALILAAHGLLGCCWHHRHVHADTLPTPTPVTAVSTETSAPPPVSKGCCHHHGHARRAGPVDNTPVPHHDDASPVDPPAPVPADGPCTEDDCVFVAGPRVNSSLDGAVEQAPPADWFGLTVLPHSAHKSAADVLSQALGSSPPQFLGELRAHRVCTGVWLI